MKIIITGGAGMIGSNLIKLLHEKKYDLFVIDNLWRGKKENIIHKKKLARIKFFFISKP